MMRRYAFLFLCLFTLLPLPAMAHDHGMPSDEVGIKDIAPALRDLKDVLPWETLAETTFKRDEAYVKDFDLYEYFEVPTYAASVKKLEGTKIRVKGFVMLYDAEDTPKEEFLITPLLPEGCGHYHGPGSLVLEVHTKTPVTKAPKDPVTYEGTLEFPKDPRTASGIFYRLKDAVPIP